MFFMGSNPGDVGKTAFVVYFLKNRHQTGREKMLKMNCKSTAVPMGCDGSPSALPS